MPSPLIDIQDLTISFGKSSPSVKNISFSIGKGEVVAVVGESGSGKSITSLAAIGLLPTAAKINSGKILFHENEAKVDLLRLTEPEMRTYRGKKIAMIFQEPMTSLNPVMRCGEQVAESLRTHFSLTKSEAKKEVIRWFKEVQLPRPEQIFESYPHQLSGGQKQRVMIAIAMCCKPDLLIADEPTTALDVTVQKKILSLIGDLQKKHNLSVLFISHDLGVVAEISDRVVVMKSGEKVEENDSSSIFSKPSHPYTMGLLACRPPLDFRLKVLPIVSDFLNQNVTPFQAEIISQGERESQLKTLFSNKPLLEITGLKTYFPIRTGLFQRQTGLVKAVDDISFSVFKGETLGLVGESGCGKSTLGRSILQLIKPTEGVVRYEGENLCLLDESQMRLKRKDLQIIFQDPYSSLNPRMRIGDAILEPMRVHGIEKDDKMRKEKVIALMEEVGLIADQYNRYPHEFSGGQRQRICIARTLSLSPKFIVCDESVSALDVSVQAQVLNLLNELKAKFDFTYIFISHDLSVVKFMSDRMVVMNKGKIEEIGVSEEVYANPQSLYTQSLIASIPKLKYSL